MEGRVSVFVLVSTFWLFLLRYSTAQSRNYNWTVYSGGLDGCQTSEVTNVSLLQLTDVATSVQGSTAYVFGGWGSCSTVYASNALFSVDMNDGFASPLGGPFPVHEVYPSRGTLGVSLPTNNPGGRLGSTLWVVGSALWMYGGQTYLTDQIYDDLWNFSLTNLQWTQVTRNGTVVNFPSMVGVYGSQYSPGSVEYAGGTNNGTHLFLIAGDSAMCVWAFSLVHLAWGWVAGASIGNPTDGNPVYLEKPCIAPTGSAGDAWFFGGRAVYVAYSNELWFFNATSLSFKMWGGQHVANQGNVYLVSNAWPGSRYRCGLAAVRDGLVLSGGNGFWNDSSTSAYVAPLNDVWVFQSFSGKWLFVNGNATTTNNNVYDSSGALVLPFGNWGFAAAAYGTKAFFFGGISVNAVYSFALAAWNTCPSGTYLANSSACVTCPAGLYSYAFGTSCTIVCPPGSYSVGGSPCTQCPIGSFVGQNGSSACESCGVGSYSMGLGASVCTLCQGGSYAAQQGLSICSNCSAGSYAPVNSSACFSCPAGTYGGQGYAQCVPCANGTFSTGGQVVCSSCPSGQYSDLGQSRCWDCVPGKYSLGQVASCCACEAGTFADSPGATVCLSCQTGRYASSPGSAGCTDCPVSTFAQNTGQTFCSSCPGNGTTYVAGTVSSGLCICPSGFYGRPYEGIRCKQCRTDLLGVSCPVNSSLPHIAPGYARASPDTDPSLTFVCIPSTACSSTGADSSFTTCASGYSGANCSSCNVGYYRNGYNCASCPSTSGIAIFFVLVLVFIGLVVAALVFVKIKSVSPEAKIAAYGLQFLGTFNVISSGWPVSLSGLFNVLSFTNLDVDIAAPECSLSINFFGKTALKLVLPVLIWIIGTAMVGVVVATKSRQPFVGVVKDRAGPLAVMTLVGLYTVIVKVLAQPLQCTQQPDGRYSLTASPDIACYESQWNAFLPWLVLFWILYVVVAPTGLLFLFRRIRGDVDLQAKYNQLVSDYRAQFYWWGLVVVLRKTVLVSSSTILSGSLKYFVTFTLLLVFHFLEISALPYKTQATMQVSLLWSIVPMVMLGALAMVFESSSVSAGAQDALAVVLVALVVAASLVAIFTKRRLWKCGSGVLYVEMKKADLTDAGGISNIVFRVARPASAISGAMLTVYCSQSNKHETSMPAVAGATSLPSAREDVTVN